MQVFSIFALDLKAVVFMTEIKRKKLLLKKTLIGCNSTQSTLLHQLNDLILLI